MRNESFLALHGGVAECLRRHYEGHTIGMKTVISMPDAVFRSAERLAARLGLSRSELYSRALKSLLARHEQEMITAQLDEVYGLSAAKAGLDPVLAAMQASAVQDNSAW